MAEIAILIGIYSYLIFALGLVGFLTKEPLVILTLGFLVLVTRTIGRGIRRMKGIRGIREIKSLEKVFIGLLMLQAVVNLIGAIGPELGFDALWYHLTLPKIYLQNKRILYIPGSLLYYSPMPKLLEMVYTAALAIQGENLAKLVHFAFGILSAVALFKLAKRYLNSQISLIVTSIFYTSLIVGWQSITAYVDLGRTFFEILALDYFLRWWEDNKNSNLIDSAIMLGLAVTTKILSLGSLLIFVTLIFVKFHKNFKKFLLFNTYYFLFTILIPLPWLVFSFIHTGNPFYPVFSKILDSSHQIVSFNLVRFFEDFWKLFLYSPNSTLPVFLIFFPFLILQFKNFKQIEKLLLAYCLFAYLIWYFIPRVGGGRFILPYLPAFSLLCGFIFENLKDEKLRFLSLFFLLFLVLINTSYRLAANYRFLPVILGKESKKDFLAKNLNFRFGDFYDVDGFLQENIQKEDLVLIYGIHNLYYVNFPFLHESWAISGTPITHVLVKDGELPKKFGRPYLVYQNYFTGIKLYLYGNRIP